MYVNFNLLLSKEVTPMDVMLLVACQQNQNGESFEALSKFFNFTDAIDHNLEKGYIEFIKGKKGDDQLKKLRISKKGKDLLSDLETPEVTQDDLVIYDWLESIYKESNKVVGNRKKTKLYIACFRTQSQIEKNCLAYLCQTFIGDSDNMEYNQKLEYMFFKPDNIYSTRFDLEQSRLYKYYLKHQEYFDKEFERL